MQTTKSFTSIDSSKSSTIAARELYKKKPTNTKKFIAKYVPPCNEVRQRVLSAKALRNKAFRNQLLEADRQIEKLKKENRMLLTIHQRQDSALSKYESSSADLPNILNAHVEELNGWEEKHRKLQNIAKELEDKIKQHESIIYNLNEDIRFYMQINKNKTLDSKENLLEKINSLEEQIRLKTEEQNKTTEHLRNEIERTKTTIVQERINCNTIGKKLKKMHLELTGMNKVNSLELEKATMKEQTNNEETDASISGPPFNINKPATVSESIPTRIPIRKLRSINTSINKNSNNSKPVSESEGETKVSNKKPLFRKKSIQPIDQVNIKPRPILRKKLSSQQGAGDGPGNITANQLRTKPNKDRGDGDGLNKHRSYLVSNRTRLLNQGKKPNVEDTHSKKVVFCEHSQNLPNLSNYGGDTDGNESLIETADSHTANMSVTSDLTADTGNLGDIDNVDDNDDHEDMPKSLIETDDDLNMDCMSKIMSAQYVSQHNPYMENYSELEHSN